MAQRRITKEAAQLQKLEGVQVLRDESDPLKETLIVDPPTGRRALHPRLGDLFFGVRLELVVRHSSDYPFRPFRLELAPALVDRTRNEDSLPSSVDGDAQNLRIPHDERGLRAMHSQWLTLPSDESTARERILADEARGWCNARHEISGADDRVIHIVARTLTHLKHEFDLPARASVHDLHAAISNDMMRQQPFTLSINNALSTPDYRKSIGDFVGPSDTSLNVHVMFKVTCNCRTLLGLSCRNDDWSSARSLPASLLQHPPHYVSCADPTTVRGSGVLRGLEALAQRCRSEGEMQWMLRAASPAPNVVWSPETDADWPMFFRRTVRLLRFVAVSHPCGVMPVEVVANVAQFL
jgi:hypothetical protein